MIVREAHHRQISEVLDRFDSTYGIRLKFSYYSIKDGSEDIGTADALREAASRNLIKVGSPHTYTQSHSIMRPGVLDFLFLISQVSGFRSG